MLHLYGLTLDQLADQASQMNLLDDYRLLQPFVYIEVNESRYVLDASMARTFWRWSPVRSRPTVSY